MTLDFPITNYQLIVFNFFISYNKSIIYWYNNEKTYLQIIIKCRTGPSVIEINQCRVVLIVSRKVLAVYEGTNSWDQKYEL